jgi:hypothetical protein
LTSVRLADLDAYGRDRQCASDSTLDEVEFPDPEIHQEGLSMANLVLDEALTWGQH